jgi:DNA-binding response OmpR family regulator
MTSKGSVLLVEDEPGLVRTVSDRLTAEGYGVRATGDGRQATETIGTGDYDLVLLDVMLPGADGFTVLREVRKRGITTPVIMLTARGQVEEKVIALRAGADDYLTKPFRHAELLARMEAVLRRSRGAALTRDEQLVRFGDWTLDLEREELRGTDGMVRLSRTEYELLAHLVRRRGQPVARKELLREVWRYAPDTSSRTVDQHVAQLRRKLSDAAKHVVTVHGRGYAFRVNPP